MRLERHRRLADLRRGDVQGLVDKMTPDKSGSRVRTVVNAIRSLYAWAQDRELVEHDPAARVRLPAMNATPRDRVATVAEMQTLLAALDRGTHFHTRSPCTPRPAEPRSATRASATWTWTSASSTSARMSADASHGPPNERCQWSNRSPSCCAATSCAAVGLTVGAALPWPQARRPKQRHALVRGSQKRVDDVWEPKNEHGDSVGKKLGDRITAHECRHTCASWLDAAGVRPVIVSRIMGHAAPALQSWCRPDHPGALYARLARRDCAYRRFARSVDFAEQ